MKTTKIAFLHTSPAHIPTFDGLLARDNVQLTHTVKEDWLREAQNDGLSAHLIEKIANHLSALAQDADAVVCTCSSLGPAAENLGLPTVFRVDQPMMSLAVQNTPVLLAMCLASTETASRKLLESAFLHTGVEPDYQCLLCGDAWQYFENNDIEQFGREIARSIKQAITEGNPAGCVVLAQASMAAAQPYLDDLGIPVYSSPALAAVRALEISGSDRSDSHV